MTDALATMNMTTSGTAAISSFSSWSGLITLAAIMTITLGILFMALSNISRYKRLIKLFRILGQSLSYFGYGILFIVLLAVPGFIIYYFEKEAINGNTVPIKYLLGIIAIYALISCLGYLFKKYIIDRVKNFNKQIAKKKND